MRLDRRRRRVGVDAGSEEGRKEGQKTQKRGVIGALERATAVTERLVLTLDVPPPFAHFDTLSLEQPAPDPDPAPPLASAHRDSDTKCPS